MKLSERATAQKPDKCECCGRAFEHPRNAARHRAFFAMLKPAFQNWPESHQEQFASIEDMRMWLLWKAGWVDKSRMQIAGGNPRQIAVAIAAFMSSKNGRKTFFVADGNSVIGYTVKSIAFSKCKEEDFRRIIDDVAGIIEAETGIAIADMKRARQTESQENGQHTREAVY